MVVGIVCVIYIYICVCVCVKTTSLLVSIASYVRKAIIDDEQFIGIVFSCHPLKQQFPSQVKAVEI